MIVLALKLICVSIFLIRIGLYTIWMSMLTTGNKHDRLVKGRRGPGQPKAGSRWLVSIPGATIGSGKQILAVAAPVFTGQEGAAVSGVAFVAARKNVLPAIAHLVNG